ncbi:hypothetical protein F4777DRAFT_9307 [Nemania sp. FL0916]|nr:hypothetical protein F4777DRAFT_9307 [Nemania sp. FL0916]
MEHRMEHNMEPLIDFDSNLAEILAVDLEQSSEIFRSRQLTAGVPAPGLADDGSRRPSPLRCSRNPILKLSSQLGSGLPKLAPLQIVDHSYTDIFAPLERGSISSSESSADLQPASVSTRGESVLTIDTWLEPDKKSDKQSDPAYFLISPASEYTAQMSWIDLDADEVSPVTLTQRRRSSMTDFPQNTQHLTSIAESGLRTLSLRSRVLNDPEALIAPVGSNPPICPLEIPNRRSSLGHPGAFTAMQQFTQGLGRRDDTGRSFPEDKVNFKFRSDMDDSNTGGDTGMGIASEQIGFDEWLESDATHLTREDQPLSRPLSPAMQERVNLYIANFPEPLLLCDSLLIDQIRQLSRGVRYNTESPKYDNQAAPGNQFNDQRPSKAPKWKWLGSLTSTVQPQDRCDTPMGNTKEPWAVMCKVFPHGSFGLCEALYAYILVYNYVTLLCVRSISSPTRPPSPSTARAFKGPDAGRPNIYGDSDDSDDIYASLLTQPALPKRDKPKWPELLGIGGEEASQGPTSLSLTRPGTGDSGNRTSTLTSLKNIPSLLFSGIGHGQQRQTAVPAGEPTSLSRPTTPPMGRASAAPRAVDQSKQLATLRRGLAMCCARLTITLQRADPNVSEHQPDHECKVNPAFMRSLCENVRSTEEAMARSS